MITGALQTLHSLFSSEKDSLNRPGHDAFLSSGVRGSKVTGNPSI